MENLTLVIPAKEEKESLPVVLKELQDFKLKKLIVLEKDDLETINSIDDTNSKIVYQVNKGYGDAIKLGIQNVQTKYFCIFNADGSFDPLELKNMMNIISDKRADLVFGSRYEKNCGSEDDTIITKIGNYIFTMLGNIFFNLKITDILYTYVIGNTDKIKRLNLESNNFSLCVELPIKAKKSGYKLVTSKSYERARISGVKKVNAFKDGLIILSSMIKLFFSYKDKNK